MKSIMAAAKNKRNGVERRHGEKAVKLNRKTAASKGIEINYMRRRHGVSRRKRRS
jgi:hypothetical protein